MHTEYWDKHSPGILTYVINIILYDNETVDDVGGYEGVSSEPEYRTACISTPCLAWKIELYKTLCTGTF